MCGIVGIIESPEEKATDLGDLLQKMTQAVERRGPDDWGMVEIRGTKVHCHSMARPDGEVIACKGPSKGPAIGLGHRRLSILDLSQAGHQPMATPDQRYWITYNGEIYNFLELRRDLEKEGIHFNSRSDTEVLLRLFERDGERCLKKLRGMFAFVVWDQVKKELFLARDRFGIKPLYFSQTTGGGLLFASEINALLASGRVTCHRDGSSEILFLQRGAIEAPHTYLRGVQALNPGCMARWQNGRLSIRSYWSYRETLTSGPRSRYGMADISERVFLGLMDSVKAHMVSDVPIGIFLSSGLDSTALLSAIRQFHQGALKTFTVIFPGTRWDEGKPARAAAAYYQTDHTEIEVTQDDFYEAFEDFFQVMDQPTIDGMNTFLIAKMAQRAGLKVALSGLGGDEMLGGYHSFVNVPRWHRLYQTARRIPGLLHFASSLAAHLPAARAPKLVQMLSGSSENMGSIWQNCRALFTDAQIQKIVKQQVKPFRSSMEDHDHEITPFWAVSCLEILHFMTPQLLRDSDVFTMCHGLELRTPFVDHLFQEAVFKMGPWDRGKAASYKMAIFRLIKGFLPPEHLNHPKMGFTFPFELWLRKGMTGKTAKGTSARDSIKQVLDKPEYQTWIEQFARGRLHWSRIWALYVLERFRRQ